MGCNNTFSVGVSGSGLCDGFHHPNYHNSSLQDKNAEIDEELIKKMNGALNGISPEPAVGAEAGATGIPAAAAAAAATPAAAPSGGAVQMADLLRAIGLPESAAPAAGAAALDAATTAATAAPAPAVTPVAPAPSTGANSTTPASAAPTTPAAAPGLVSAEQLAAAMAGIAAGGNGSSAAGGNQSSGTTLQAVATPEAVTASGALSDAGVLLPTLPEGHQTPQELYDTVHSPQFAQVCAI